jgi:hypothetical protein
VADPAGGGTLAVTMPPALSTYFHCRKFNREEYNSGVHGVNPFFQFMQACEPRPQIPGVPALCTAACEPMPMSNIQLFTQKNLTVSV